MWVKKTGNYWIDHIPTLSTVYCIMAMYEWVISLFLCFSLLSFCALIIPWQVAVIQQTVRDLPSSQTMSAAFIIHKWCWHCKRGNKLTDEYDRDLPSIAGEKTTALAVTWQALQKAVRNLPSSQSMSAAFTSISNAGATSTATKELIEHDHDCHHVRARKWIDNRCIRNSLTGRPLIHVTSEPH